MSNLLNYIFWATVWLYLLSTLTFFILFASSVIARSPVRRGDVAISVPRPASRVPFKRLLRFARKDRNLESEDAWVTWGWRSLIVAWCSLTFYIGLRWAVTGHPPVMYQFENAVLGAWVLSFIFLIFSMKYYKIRAIGIAIAPLVIMMLGYGLTGGTGLLPLSPPFRSNWLWVHVTFAWAAYGSFVIAAVLAVLYLLKERNVRRSKRSKEAPPVILRSTVRRGDEESGLKNPSLDSSTLLRSAQSDTGKEAYGWLPELPKLEDFILMFIILGFITQALMIASGSIWARILWGSFWNWDPIETWSLLVWLAYGLVLHLRLSLAWRGTRFAWVVLGALIFEIVCFGGVGFMPAPHTPLLWRNMP